MARFEIKVVSMALSEVTDKQTGKTYSCKNVWYTRENYKKFYVNVESVETKQMKSMYSFPWKAEIIQSGENKGKLKGTSPVGMIIQSDLSGKTSQAMPLEDAFF